MTTRPASATLLPLLFGAVLVGCGGGGGGEAGPVDISDPDPAPRPTLVTAPFETPEYEKQEGLRLINASSLYARGGTGEGVVVGVLDSGASPDHPDLRGQYTGDPLFYPVALPGFPLHDGLDRLGHGTHISGIIAARKDGVEMHGVAHEAKVAMAGFETFRTEERSEDEYQDGAVAYLVRRMREDGVRIINNSWGTFDNYADRSVTQWTREEALDTYDRAIPEWRRYVEAGGVVIFTTSNIGWYTDPTLEGGLPYLFPELEEGWLAVTAVNLEGLTPGYATKCGLAADWCIAAPGGGEIREDLEDGSISSLGIHSTWLEGGYRRFSGTSMAAPHVAGALAGLKSLFPNLSYHQLRDRILETANSEPPWNERNSVGHGLLDLDAASRPVGGVSFALGAYDEGPVAPTAGAFVALPPAAIAKYLAGRDVLVLDHYQRAPFQVPIDAFARPRGGRLSLHDLDLDLETPDRRRGGRAEASSFFVAGDGFRAHGASNGAWFFGSGFGPRVMDGMARAVDAALPAGSYRMAEDAFGVTFGFASDAGRFYAGGAFRGAAGSDAGSQAPGGFGIFDWRPESVFMVSFVPSRTDAAFGASVASGLRRPMGWAGAGALDLSGDSFDLAWRHDLAARGRVRLGVESRLAWLAPEAGALVRFDDSLLAASELALSYRLGRVTFLNARLGVERPLGSSTGAIRVASDIDETGRIGYDDVRIEGSDLLSFDKAGVSVVHAPRRNVSIGGGVAAVRDGFGEADTVVGGRVEVRFPGRRVSRRPPAPRLRGG